ncbi:MAG: UDP-3-O-(3-hydroxymyristoyl)glucosamine N-acyltransferase [Gammaproteobacteria bacterium]|nr:UDP-3-O-(3-hydroxymyristoyl)glucosamine N-acyltransferase [Gammaproteobacteria bacterium]
MTLTLGDLAERTGAQLQGDAAIVIDGVCTLQDGRPGRISFLANPQYRKYLADTRAGAVILDAAHAADCPVPALISGNPYVTYARVATLLSETAPAALGVHPSAVVAADCRIDPTASIGPLCVIESGAEIAPGVAIGPSCVIGRDVRIGADTRLVANVTLCHGVQLGARCLIHPGAVIGSDGFGLANESGRWLKVPQLGSVRVGDDVEIGANTSIDRGALEDTVIGAGVKLDNQIQVAHNVQIGEHTAVAGCVGISGSAKIGAHCMLAGGVGVVGHLEIADGTVVTGMSMVTKSITERGVYSSGLAAMPSDQWNKLVARLKRLDDMARRLQALERTLERKPDGKE